VTAHYTQPQTRDRVWRQRVNELNSEIRNLKAHLAHANLRAAQADKRAEAAEETLRFYADPGSYASPWAMAGQRGLSPVWADQGARARAVLS
jgi:uncharacterized protein YukE